MSESKTDNTAAQADEKAKGKTPALRIAASTDSFFRCGVEFTRTPKDYKPGRFTPDEVERLKATGTLVVVELPTAAAK